MLLTIVGVGTVVDVVPLTVEGVGTGAFVDTVVVVDVDVVVAVVVAVVAVIFVVADVVSVVVSVVADDLPTIPAVRLSVGCTTHTLA